MQGQKPDMKLSTELPVCVTHIFPQLHINAGESKRTRKQEKLDMCYKEMRLRIKAIEWSFYESHADDNVWPIPSDRQEKEAFEQTFILHALQ